MTATPGELMLATRALADAMRAYRNAHEHAQLDARYADRRTAAQVADVARLTSEATANRDRKLTEWIVAHGWEQPAAAAPVRGIRYDAPRAMTLAEQLAWRGSHPLPMRDYDGAPMLGALGAVRGSRRGRRGGR